MSAVFEPAQGALPASAPGALAEPARGSVRALSPAQHKAALWADDRLHVYAVVMGSRIDGLPARLAAAADARQLGDHDCLRPGALTPAEQRAAPYLARLQRESAFTDWLLFEAAAALGDWGVLACTGATKLALRSHLRGLLAAQLPGGQLVTLDWMDPTLLDAIVPLFEPAALAAFMGPVQALVAPGADVWTTFRLALGRLERSSTALARPGAAAGTAAGR